MRIILGVKEKRVGLILVKSGLILERERERVLWASSILAKIASLYEAKNMYSDHYSIIFVHS
jgi:hypothetical protein